MRTSVEPFRFYARFALTLATGRRAGSLRELRDGMAKAPATVIYRHTHRFVADHAALVPEPSNDFALWVEEALQDDVLAERLGAVDVLAFTSLEDLRRTLVGILDEALAAGEGRLAPPGRAFHFLDARRFSVPTGAEARDLPSFAEALGRAGPSSLFLHLFEARLRPPLGVNDFSLWFRKSLGEEDLARAVADVDLYRHTLEDLRRQILELVRTRIEFDAAKEPPLATP